MVRPAAAAYQRDPENLEFTRNAHGAARRVARGAPHSIAVEDAQRSLTYGELDAEARSIQADLTGHGIAAESIVAVLVSRSVLLESALLGILRAGGAYLPLDPDLPDARLVQLVNDARPDAVVTTPDLEPRLRAVQAPIVRVGHTGQRSAVVLPTAPVAPKD
ncbi:AMP-binding protein, partial [Propioniciclava flava]